MTFWGTCSDWFVRFCMVLWWQGRRRFFFFFFFFFFSFYSNFMYVSVVQSSYFITPLGKVGAGCCPGHMFEHPRFVSSRAMSLPLGAGGGLRSVIGATPGYLLIVFLCCFLLLHLTENARFHPCIFFVKQYFTKSNATSKVYVWFTVSNSALILIYFWFRPPAHVI